MATDMNEPDELIEALRRPGAWATWRRTAADEIERLRADEETIRADERAKIAALIEEHKQTLTDFTGDDTNTLALVAYLLRLGGVS